MTKTKVCFMEYLHFLQEDNRLLKINSLVPGVH